MKRPNGFYWVTANTREEVAQWTNGDGIPHPPANPDADWGHWDLIGDECGMGDDEVVVLYGPILPPSETK